jgi:RimJ/RimL family protein N-acetyltransferase
MASPQNRPKRPPRPVRRPPAEPPLALPARGLEDGVVRLRLPQESDAHAIAEGCSDPEVARWTLVPSPYTLEDARAWIALATVQSKGDRELALVIVRPGEDRPVGGAALRVRTDPEPHGDIGYWVAAAARRQGVGKRAVLLLADHGLGALGLPFIEISVSPDNEASRRLALSAGFEPHDHRLREFKGRLEEFDIFRRYA